MKTRYLVLLTIGIGLLAVTIPAQPTLGQQASVEPAEQLSTEELAEAHVTTSTESTSTTEPPATESVIELNTTVVPEEATQLSASAADTTELLTTESTTSVPAATNALQQYAMSAFMNVLDNIMQTLRDFLLVSLSQNTQHSSVDYAWLKRYLEQLTDLLHSEQELDDALFTRYERFGKKLLFLQGEPTSRELQQHLSADDLHGLQRVVVDLQVWLNKQVERLRLAINQHTLEEPLRNQYFNAAFDDIQSTRRLPDKLSILAGILRIIVLDEPIRFTDLYMQ